jgi:ArsR family transcriptional regulator
LIVNLYAAILLVASYPGVVMVQVQLNPLQLFKALSDETRLSLVLLLREKGELCVCELTSILREAQPKISRHLALLRDSGLLIDRRDGKWIHYRLSPHMPAWAAAVIEQAYLCQRDDILHLSQQAERDNATTNGKPVCI